MGRGNTMDPLDFLDAPEGADQTVNAPETDLDDAAPPGQAPEEGDHSTEGAAPAGAAAEPDPPADPETPPPPAAPQSEERVPLAELIKVRERAQRAEARLAALERAPPQPAQPRPAPDRFEDPEAYEAWKDEQINARLQTIELRNLNDRLNFSERMAISEHGRDVVQEAKEWAEGQGQQDPRLWQHILAQADPYEALVQEFKRAQTTAAFSDPNTLAKFNAWLASQNAGDPATAAPAAPAADPATAPPARPSRSLATRPGAGAPRPGDMPTGPGVAFDGAIPS